MAVIPLDFDIYLNCLKSALYLTATFFAESDYFAPVAHELPPAAAEKLNACPWCQLALASVKACKNGPPLALNAKTLKLNQNVESLN